MACFFAAPSGSPLHLQGYAPDPYSIQLSWDTVPLHQQNGIIQRYVVSGLASEWSEEFEIPSYTNSVTVTDLRAFTAYTFQVAAETVGVGPFSNETNITTPQDGEYYSFTLIIV